MIFVLLLVIFLSFFPVSGLLIATSHLCSLAVSNGPPPSFFSRSDDSLRPCPLLHSSLVSLDLADSGQLLVRSDDFSSQPCSEEGTCRAALRSWTTVVSTWNGTSSVGRGGTLSEPYKSTPAFLGSLKVERGLNFLWWDVCSQVMNSSQWAEVLLLLFPPHCSYKHCVYNQTLTYFRF